MTWYIYILRLKNNKYYVGRTQNVWKRINEHFQGTLATEWTSLHRPIQLISVYQSSSRFDEDNQTKRMMQKHSIDNVRGGSYVRIELPQHQKLVLRRQLNSLTNRCFKCGKKGHFAKECTFGEEKKERTPHSTRIKELNSQNNSHKQVKQNLTPPKRSKICMSISSQEDQILFQSIIKGIHQDKEILVTTGKRLKEYVLDQ